VSKRVLNILWVAMGGRGVGGRHGRCYIY